MTVEEIMRDRLGGDFIDMKEELQAVFDRSVDLLTKQSLKNPFRRRSIQTSQRVIYAA